MTQKEDMSGLYGRPTLDSKKLALDRSKSVLVSVAYLQIAMNE